MYISNILLELSNIIKATIIFLTELLNNDIRPNLIYILSILP
jgi:hypothetical protein